MRTSVSWEFVREFIRALDVRPEAVGRIEITPGKIAVTTYRLDDTGRRYPVGAGEQIEPATVTTAIAVVSDLDGDAFDTGNT